MNDPDVHANDIFPFPRRFVPIGIVAAGLFALTMVAIIVGLGRKPSYDVLFADLGPDAAASIASKLAADNVPYDLTTTGGRTTIRIPTDQISSERTRMFSSAKLRLTTPTPAASPAR